MCRVGVIRHFRITNRRRQAKNLQHFIPVLLDCEFSRVQSRISKVSDPLNVANCNSCSAVEYPQDSRHQLFDVDQIRTKRPKTQDTNLSMLIRSERRSPIIANIATCSNLMEEPTAQNRGTDQSNLFHLKTSYPSMHCSMVQRCG